MTQQDFDNFKQHLKEWMNTHPKEFDCFEAEMNDKDAIGYQKILSKAIAFVPQYHVYFTPKVYQYFIPKVYHFNLISKSD